MTHSYESFDAWMRRVDLALVERLGLDHMSLMDVDYYGMFLDEVDPEEAARSAVENECDDMGFDVEEIWGEEGKWGDVAYG